MLADVKRWGNSLAIRLSKEDLERLGIDEGERVRVTIEKLPRDGEVDISGLPTFRDEDPRASERHDRVLYGE